MTRLCRRLLPLLALLVAGPAAAQEAQASDPLTPDALTPEQEAFLDDLQRKTFDWFWDTTPADNGLTPDRWPDAPFSSIAAVGFALPAYGIGAERGYVTRAQAAERTLTTLRFFWEAPQGARQTGMTGYKGFFYHFLDMETGERFATTELSSIDSALLFGGVLFAREYFDGEAPGEAAIRAYADSLVQRAEWDWFRRESDVRVRMGWRPEPDDFGRAQWNGYNEAMLLYVLALGTPTFALDGDAWDAWTRTYEWADFYGYEHVNFEPLFGHQYSHLFLDFRGIQDAYLRAKSDELGAPFDYFENSRRATLSQRAYAVDNPMGWADYGADIWGLTACDGPFGGTLAIDGEERRFMTYSARGASAQRIIDDGTITPTAAGGSIPFAPAETIAALMAMRDRYGSVLYTDDYGFRDAFNATLDPEKRDLEGVRFAPDDFVIPGTGWVNAQYLGIDQGPILIMAENFRTGLVWETLRQSPYLVRGLRRAGFEGGWLDDAPDAEIPVVIAARQPEEAPVSLDGRAVIVLGSSTAQGTGPRRAQNAWVNRFRAYLQTLDADADVFNLARGGYSTYQILPDDAANPEGRPAVDSLRNISRALRLAPDAIVVGMTSNDAAYGYTVEEQLANFEALIEAGEAAGIPVFLTTTAPRNFDGEARAKQEVVRDALFERYGDRVIDVWTDFARPDGSLDPVWDSGDGVHQNDAAHALIFRRVKTNAALMEALGLGEAVEAEVE